MCSYVSCFNSEYEKYASKAHLRKRALTPRYYYYKEEEEEEECKEEQNNNNFMLLGKTVKQNLQIDPV